MRNEITGDRVYNLKLYLWIFENAGFTDNYLAGRVLQWFNPTHYDNGVALHLYRKSKQSGFATPL